MLTTKYFPALQKTEILPEKPVSETRNHTLNSVIALIKYEWQLELESARGTICSPIVRRICNI